MPSPIEDHRDPVDVGHPAAPSVTSRRGRAPALAAKLAGLDVRTDAPVAA